ncbi:hypothetical protein HDU97_009649, partial [Phlyctochytrium planicorne]
MGVLDTSDSLVKERTGEAALSGLTGGFTLGDSANDVDVDVDPELSNTMAVIARMTTMEPATPTPIMRPLFKGGAGPLSDVRLGVSAGLEPVGSPPADPVLDGPLVSVPGISKEVLVPKVVELSPELTVDVGNGIFLPNTPIRRCFDGTPS